VAKTKKTESKPMTTDALKKMVGMIIRLDRQISLRERHLKSLKAALTREARLRKAEHQKTDGGGWSWVVEGTGGNVARVTKHGDTLRSEIADDSDLYFEVVGLCIDNDAITETDDQLGKFKKLFDERVSYIPVKGIRDEAKAVLGETKAEKLIHQITNSGKTSVSFETKQRRGDNDERKEK
jgi:hypothetical protein